MGVRQIFLSAAALLASASAPAAAGAPDSSTPPPAPRLAVLIVVDQFGSNLLQFHRPALTGGFHRLLDRSRFFPNAVVDHAPTNSLPGHLSVATGAHPRRHGIVDNSWTEVVDGRPATVSGFVDPGCRKLRPNGAVTQADESAIGPARFEAATVVEWVLASNAAARFASVGTGGGVSALHAGKARGPVLWFDTSNGGYVSSTCYLDRMPAWALRFNESLVERYMDEDWRLSAPPAMTAKLRPDDSAFENSGRDTHFPHVRPEAAELAGWFNSTPFADEATLGLARAAVVEEKLGADSVTDILTIGLSTLDHVGHRYGPFSVEQADAVHRLDQNLGAFLDFLDRQVGEGEWVLALTADHGAPPAPEAAARFGVEHARRIPESDVLAAIDAVRAAAGRFRDSAAAASAASSLGFIGRVIRVEGLSNPGDEVERLYANSYRPGRVSRHPFYGNAEGEGVSEFGIIPIPHPYWVVDWATSIHGSPYSYDRQVPVLFYDATVPAGVDLARVRTIDVAPTLGALIGVSPTAEVDGRRIDLRR